MIEFIGGEVTLHWDMLTDLIDWAHGEAHRWTKHHSFFIDTNATMLTEERKDWLRERRDWVIVGTSLDGTRDAHDINRCGSFDDVLPQLPFLVENWPDQTIKMTLSPATVPYLYRGILETMAHGFQVAANVPMEDIWGTAEQKAETVAEFRRQIEMLAAFFSENPDLPIPSIINLPIQIIHSEERDRPWCGSGRSMAAVDVDGTLLPCNRYARMSFDHALIEKPIADVRLACTSCLFKPACQTCEAHNWEANGNPNARTRFHCEFTKLQVWGTAQVRFHRLSRLIAWIEKEYDEGRGSDQLDQELLFAHLQLQLISEILSHFEAAERDGLPLHEVGTRARAGEAFVPPTEALWAQTGMFTPLPGSIAARRETQRLEADAARQRRRGERGSSLLVTQARELMPDPAPAE